MSCFTKKMDKELSLSIAKFGMFLHVSQPPSLPHSLGKLASGLGYKLRPRPPLPKDAPSLHPFVKNSLN